jgi:HD superfamily phosphohydrolase YqeK
MGMMRSSVGRYLRFSLIATALVVVLPSAGGAITYFGLAGEPRLRWATLVAAGACTAVLMVGTLLWRRRPESADVSFGELMLWRFFKRARAEERLNDSARALGLDLGGRPLRRTQISASERLKILHSLAKALESKDPYTHGHSTRVEHLSVRTAQALGLSESEIQDLKTAALLHDVGKIRIPTRVLRKPSALTLEEQLIVQEHSSVGAWMVSGVSNRRVAMSVRHHHERWDGNGYPDGVAGRDIPLFARIIAVADSFDAMTSERPYRSTMSRDTALDEIHVEAGSQFDPVVVDAFLEAVPRRITVSGLIVPGVAAALVRRALRWTRRIGTTQAAETVAGAGIAALVAASVFLPPAASPAEVNRANESPEVWIVDEAPIVADPLQLPSKQADNVVLGKHLTRSDSKKSQEDHKGKSGSTDEPAATPAVETGPGLSIGGNSHTGAPESSGKPADVPDAPNGPPEPSDPPEVEIEKDHGDPQPEHGRDCIDHPGQGEGGGNTKHCG